MSWESLIKEKEMSLEDAAALIQSNDRVYIAGSATMPYRLLDILYERAYSLHNVRMLGSMALRPLKFLSDPNVHGHLDYETLFCGFNDRVGVKNGNTHINSVHFGKAIQYMRNDFLPNVVMTEVSAPDAEGYMTWGPVGVALLGEIFELPSIETKIVVINHHQPANRNGIKTKIHVSEVDVICYDDHSVYGIPDPVVTETDRKIAEWIVPFIKDGATIQLGIGGLSNAIGYSLMGKKHLGLQSEMLTDSIVALIKAGVIDHERALAAFGLGNKAMYDFIETGAIRFAPLSVVNDPYLIGQNDNFISVNGCLMADLTGQVCSESIGFRQYSSTGGQLEFVKGAALSKGGKSFLCLHSTMTDKSGETISKIRCTLPPGAVVTTPRSEVMYIATEYGVADLYLKPIERRVKAMIEIAHPDMRHQLREEAIEAGLLRRE